MGENDWLFLDSDITAVLSGQHVNFSLIHTQLADISTEEEDIGTLHARI